MPGASLHIGHCGSTCGENFASCRGVKYALCKIKICESLSEAFGEADLTPSKISCHSESSKVPRSSTHLALALSDMSATTGPLIEVYRLEISLADSSPNTVSSTEGRTSACDQPAS